jgi:hypothetical protein
MNDAAILSAAIVSALEALGDGDQNYATEILLSTQEDGPTERLYRCECGWSGQWPGLLEAHQLNTGHGFEETE